MRKILIKFYKQWREYVLAMKIREIRRKYAELYGLITDGSWERLCHFQKMEQEEINSLKSSWK